MATYRNIYELSSHLTYDEKLLLIGCLFYSFVAFSIATFWMFRFVIYKYGLYNLVHNIFSTSERIKKMASRGFGNWKFVNIRLSSEDLDGLNHFIKQFDGTAIDALEELNTTGYKVSHSWQDKQTAFNVTVSGTDNSPANYQRSMSTYSDDLDQAIMMTLYKVMVVCEGKDWEKYEKDSSNWG